MSQLMSLAVPLHKVYKWRITCPCGCNVDIGSGAINCVSIATCPKCKTAMPLDDILPVLKAAKQQALSLSNYKLSAIIMHHSCEDTI